MSPTVEEFQALARSAPWRFRRAHFVVSGTGLGNVEAQLERPGRLRYRLNGARWRTEKGPSHASASYGIGEQGRLFRRERQVWACESAPEWRPDGLVAQRPTEFEDMTPDDPMLTNYLWVAMLDPVELSHDVTLTEIAEVTHHGRRAWQARAVPGPGYEPRCGCCPVLWSSVSDQIEVEAGWSGPEDGVFGPYPVDHVVRLDHATGMLVQLQAGPGAARRDRDVDVRIVQAS